MFNISWWQEHASPNLDKALHHAQVRPIYAHDRITGPHRRGHANISCCCHCYSDKIGGMLTSQHQFPIMRFSRPLPWVHLPTAWHSCSRQWCRSAPGPEIWSDSPRPVASLATLAGEPYIVAGSALRSVDARGGESPISRKRTLRLRAVCGR